MVRIQKCGVKRYEMLGDFQQRLFGDGQRGLGTPLIGRVDNSLKIRIHDNANKEERVGCVIANYEKKGAVQNHVKVRIAAHNSSINSGDDGF